MDGAQTARDAARSSRGAKSFKHRRRPVDRDQLGHLEAAGEREDAGSRARADVDDALDLTLRVAARPSGQLVEVCADDFGVEVQEVRDGGVGLVIVMFVSGMFVIVMFVSGMFVIVMFVAVLVVAVVVTLVLVIHTSSVGAICANGISSCL